MFENFMNLFQFLMVRLKDNYSYKAVFLLTLFQFLMVRLKEGCCVNLCNTDCTVSIPYGTIKSTPSLPSC